MIKNIFKDPLTRNIWYLSLLVFVLSLQVLIVIAFVYQFVPVAAPHASEGIPQALLKTFRPNRNDFFYHVFVATALLGQVLVFNIFRKRLNQPSLADNVRPFLIAEALWVSWQLLAVFKINQYYNPAWAKVLLYLGFAAALLAKIFWPELNRYLKYGQKMLTGTISPRWRYAADGAIMLMVLLVIAIPDTQKAIVRMAMIAGNNHFDQWLMAPLGAFNPPHGGMIILVHALVNVIGGVSYGHVLTVACFLAIIYYIAFYYLLRFWLGILPAAFGVLLAIKLQMFNVGVSPLIWAFPAQSVLRHLGDVAVFGALLCYARGLGEIFLWLAGAAVGASLVLVLDTGIYMMVAFYAYLAVLLSFKDTRCLLCKTPRQWRKVLGMAMLPWVIMMIVAFTGISYSLGADSPVSIFSCLRERNFFAFFASFFPPLLYVIGIAIVLQMIFKRYWTAERLFLIPLSIYGLGIYTAFLWHGTINYYYMAPLPLVACLCFWGTMVLEGTIKKEQRRWVQLILVGLVAIGLLTDSIFIYYPNVFNLSGENWAQEKAAYQGKI